MCREKSKDRIHIILCLRKYQEYRKVMWQVHLNSVWEDLKLDCKNYLVPFDWEAWYMDTDVQREK